MSKVVLAAIVVLAIATSCKKDYVCVCTEKSTGEKSYGEHFKAGPLYKKAAEESCASNDDVFSSDVENCHLE